MPGPHHVVVDGSNLATEGRTVPSLAQLDEAVRAYLEEDPGADVVVVVDASFGHRIAPAERAQLEAAELHGELVAPPAGAIGRGDAFVLRIAERTGATVLSNDSFQEFHGEHPWLFDDGRLIGGKPVPGVGWIFTPRRPVRGPRSRKAARDADEREAEEAFSPARQAAEVAKAIKKASKAIKKASKATKATKATKAKAAAGAPIKAGNEKGSPAKGQKKKATKEAAPATDGPQKPRKAARDLPAAKPAKKVAAKKTAVTKAAAKAKSKDAPAEKAQRRTKKAKAPASATKAVKRATKSAVPLDLRTAIDTATQEVLAPGDGADLDGSAAKPKRRRRVPPPPAVNEPLAFIDFVATHPVGSVVEGVVVSFTSHGAMVDVPLDGTGMLHCYAPLTGLGTPPPRAARDVLKRGERREFALIGLDPPRRMAELALPELARSQLAARGRGPRAVG